METSNVNARKNYAEMKKGDELTLEGLEVKRIKQVGGVRSIEQMRAPADNPTGKKEKQQVNQMQFSTGGRSFTITGDDTNANLLSATVNGKAKAGEEVVKVYLIANTFNKILTNEAGEIMYEADGTTPMQSKDESLSWIFDGLVTSKEEMAQEERDSKKTVLRNKANILSNANVMSALKDALQEA